MKTLKDFRKAIGKTQIEMAESLGISKSFYEKVESGVRKPSRELIEKIKTIYPLLDVNIFLEFNHTDSGINNNKNTNQKEGG